MTRLRLIAVVLAGGSGTRFGHALPKQLVPLAGRPLMEHAIATLQRCTAVDEIVVVMAPGHLDQVRARAAASGHDKVRHVVPGGGSRSDSTVAALQVLGPAEADVLLHDAARPLVSEEIVAAHVAALAQHEAVTTAVASVDTVIAVDPSGRHMVQTLPRPRLRRLQTPQSFRLSTLRRAYAAAALDPDFTATDDATVVLRYAPDVPVAVVPGDEANLKVTTPVDLAVAEELLRRRDG